MYKYRVKQHLIILKLYSVPINKILVKKFITVKVSQNLNLISTDHLIPKQLAEYKISKLECENIKLSFEI